MAGPLAARSLLRDSLLSAVFDTGVIRLTLLVVCFVGLTLKVSDVGESGTSWLLARCLGLVHRLYLLLSVVHRVASTRREDVQIVVEGRFIVSLNDA